MDNLEILNSDSGLQKLSNFVLFKTADGKVNIDVFFKDETLWLTQKLISELFEKGRSTITEHLKKIFSEGELEENVVCRGFRHTTQHGAIEGKTQEKEVKYYNLKAIVAVGYRVNSHRAIEFRKWATQILHEYEIYRIIQDGLYESDFDRIIKKLK
ncbi:MAG: virulence RhuM family protein [Bacteroidales bacterium]|nr:virulence RhuM family protein [Bacteroidales bacterium]MCF8457950.1 virulence RhuM family protein [Bacteroidales bacterium]